MEIKRLVMVIVAIVVAILIINSASKFFDSKDEHKEYYTIYELQKEIYSKMDDGEELDKSFYKVKDEVTSVEKIKLPKFTIIENKSYYDLEYNYNESVYLYILGFKSLDGGHIYISTDSNITFKAGKQIEFKLPVSEYKKIGESISNSWKTIEPFFLRRIMMRYRTHILFNHVELSNISKDIVINNITNSFHYNLTFNSISDFYPFPVKWKHVNMSMSEDYREKYFDDFHMNVYHGDTYLGRLESDDPRLDKFIEPGDRIEIAGFNYTGGLEYVPIQLETYHPSDIENELISPFPVTPRFDIYFEDGK